MDARIEVIEERFGIAITGFTLGIAAWFLNMDYYLARNMNRKAYEFYETKGYLSYPIGTPDDLPAYTSEEKEAALQRALDRIDAMTPYRTEERLTRAKLVDAGFTENEIDNLTPGELMVLSNTELARARKPSPKVTKELSDDALKNAFLGAMIANIVSSMSPVLVEMAKKPKPKEIDNSVAALAQQRFGEKKEE
jgi:hypothetical protein